MDEKTFMDKYMAAFSKFTDAQARGEDVNQVFADMKKTMTGYLKSKKEISNGYDILKSY